MNRKSLKPGWRLVKFGDVVRLSKARSQDPLADGIERYVGLEHLEPGDLRIRNWGNVADGVTFTSVFQPGQVLFGKRRAYQRKVAVADFSGVCSGDIYVLETKDAQVLLPELLPFICQTDAFFDHAVGTSAGSLSPRTNWTSLADFEFPLAPLDEQTRLVDAFQALERTSEAHRRVGDVADQLVRSLLSDVLNREWPVVELGSVVHETQYGLSINAGSDGQYPMLRMMNIEDGLCVENDIKYVDLNDKDFEAYRLIHGDVLFNRTNSYELVGRTGVYELNGDHVFASYLVRIKTNTEKLEPKFLTLYLNSDFGRRQVLAYATKAVSQANVNASNLLRVRLPLPPLDVQQQLLDEIAKAKSAEKAAIVRRTSSEAMKKQLFAEITGDAR
ncbi:restriction endonuclease subunit S [Pandoraea apista]|uniref:restriction endonuclease subunit S n=1 Tax=Pandoraea apista TaxID=93218 RepID=UPI001FD23103|nr:restriction endonuclease subunit S [Pandoraea apista]